MDLADVLASPAPLRWFVGRVLSVQESGTLTMLYLGGEVSGVGYIDQVTPIRDDVIHGVMWNDNGFLVLGTNNKAGLTQPVPIPPPIIVMPTSMAIVGPAGWEPNALPVADPTHRLAWFYGTADPTVARPDFTDALGTAIASFEVEVTRVSGGPPEFFAHNSLGPDSSLAVVEDRFVKTQPPVGVATWVPLPVRWGELFVTGGVHGVGIGGGIYSGTYSGTGRLRVQALVTGT